MSRHLCVAWMRRSIHLIRGYPLRSFKRKCIVLNYSYLSSCIIPGFDLKKNIQRKITLKAGDGSEPRLQSWTAALALRWAVFPLSPRNVGPFFSTGVKHESEQKMPESLWRAGFVFLSGFKVVLAMFFLLYQKTCSGSTAFFPCQSCTLGSPEKFCTRKAQTHISFPFSEILRNFKANWNLSEVYYQAKKPLSVG